MLLMVSNKHIILLISFLISFNTGFSQSIKELESEKNAITKRIENSSKLLAKYNSQKSSSIKSIAVLNNQIKDRENLIKIYDEEIRLLEIDINLLNEDIDKNKKELETLKDQYALLINETYKNKKVYNELSFFFGASSFNEAYRRYNMLKEYNRFRHNQGLLIQQKGKELDESALLLSSKLKVQNNALKRVTKERDELKSNIGKVNRNIQDLNKKERQIKRDIAKQKKSLKKLEDTIVKMIAELSKSTVEPTNFHLAKGKLQWPISNGVIVSKFGEHQHPVLKYVKINNNGIDIQSSNSNEAKCVFKGTVSRVVSIPGYNKAVLIRHGQYLTVYANLEKVSVKNGQNVTNNSVIGTIYSGEGENSDVLHFEIWEESVKLNPESWLK